MSVYTLKLSCFQISPRIWADKNCLYARTSIIYRCLNLFFYSRTVRVDRVRKQIEITVTTFWFFKSKEYIEFSDIEYVDISKREVGESYGFTPDGLGAFDATEIYYVQVRRKSSPYPFSLFRFIGRGSRYTGWLGVLMGDSIIDTEGWQEEKAYHYASLLSDFTGVKFWRDRSVVPNISTDDFGVCPGCGHKIKLSVRKCVYCGRENKI